MAWGNRSEGIDDLIKKLSNAKSLAVLASRSFGMTEAVRFAEVLSENTIIEELYVSGHDIGEEGAAAFGRALMKNTCLKIICIGNELMGNEGLSALVDGGLSKNVGLKVLDLEYKSISCGAKLAELLSLHSTLVELRLGRNRLGDECIVDLSNGLKCSKSITSLDLSNNLFGVGGTQCLGCTLPPTLMHLNLSNNNLCGEAGASLFSYLAQAKNSTLSSLKLRHCNLDADAVSALQAWSASDDSYSRQTGLKRLDLTGNSIGANGALVAIKSSANLEWLSLFDTSMGDDGAINISSNCPDSLIFLDASMNNLTFHGIRPLFNLTYISELRLFNNLLGNDGVCSLESVLPSLHNIESPLSILDLSSNRLTGSGISQLLDIIKSFKQIRTLELGGNIIDELAEESIEAFLSIRSDVDVFFRVNG